jgi:hypothetical protein
MRSSTKISLLLIAAFSGAILMYLDIETMFFGKFINYFFPCQESFDDSAHCYLNYDVAAISALSMVCGLFLIAAIVLAIRYLCCRKK